MKNRGWIVWTWGKLGSMIFFIGMMMMLLAAYAFASSSVQAESANKLSSTLRNLILDTYDSVGDMSFEYELPRSINGKPYEIEVLDKSGDMVGILTKTKNGDVGLLGASSFAVPISDGSFGVLHGLSEGATYICIVKYRGIVYLERSKCS